MRMAHADSSHYLGSERTVIALQTQTKVVWAGMRKMLIDTSARVSVASLPSLSDMAKPQSVGLRSRSMCITRDTSISKAPQTRPEKVPGLYHGRCRSHHTPACTVEVVPDNTAKDSMNRSCNWPRAAAR